MATSQKIKTFNTTLKRVVAPEMEKLGYVFDKRRTFRRRVASEGLEIVQIIEFQIGIKGLVGRFTVNYGDYSDAFRPSDWENPESTPQSWNCLPDRRHRLGMLRTPDRTILDKILKRTPEPSDYWWSQKENPDEMACVFLEIIGLIQTKAQPYLDNKGSLNSFKRSFDELAERREIKEQNQGMDFTGKPPVD